MIFLAKIHRLDVLLLLYDEVIIPAAVLDEVAAKPGEVAEQIQTLVQEQKFQVRQATKHFLERLPRGLGVGEREAIALTMETTADLVILDDQQGRQVARDKGLSVTGTIGVFVEARGRGLVASVRRELDRLIEAGIWIDEAFYHRILQEFDE